MKQQSTKCKLSHIHINVDSCVVKLRCKLMRTGTTHSIFGHHRKAETSQLGCFFIKRIALTALDSFHHCLVWPWLPLMHSGKNIRYLFNKKNNIKDGLQVSTESSITLKYIFICSKYTYIILYALNQILSTLLHVAERSEEQIF